MLMSGLERKDDQRRHSRQVQTKGQGAGMRQQLVAMNIKRRLVFQSKILNKQCDQFEFKFIFYNQRKPVERSSYLVSRFCSSILTIYKSKTIYKFAVTWQLYVRT